MLHLALFSNTQEKLGGADRSWINVANALGPERIRLTWIGVKGTECVRPFLNPELKPHLIDSGMPLWGFLTHENMFDHHSPWLWTKILGRQWLDLREPHKIVREALANDLPDIVVTNSSVVHLGALYARGIGRPHVWCVKEWLDPKIKTCRNLAWAIEQLSHTVTVPSRAMTPAFKKIRVCPDGCNIPQVEAGVTRSREEIMRELGWPLDRPLVAQIAGFYYWKGQHVAAEMWAHLSRKGGPPPASLLFLGAGNTEYKASVEAILQPLPQEWRDAVQWKRFPPEDFSYIAAADVILHPPVLPDPWPNAVRESMVLGKPVLASADGGPAEMIEDEKTGLLAAPKDAGAFAEQLERLLADADLRQRLGEAARAYAQVNLNVVTRKDEFWKVIQEAAASRQ